MKRSVRSFAHRGGMSLHDTTKVQTWHRSRFQSHIKDLGLTNNVVADDTEIRTTGDNNMTNILEVCFLVIVFLAAGQNVFLKNRWCTFRTLLQVVSTSWRFCVRQLPNGHTENQTCVGFIANSRNTHVGSNVCIIQNTNVDFGYPFAKEP